MRESGLTEYAGGASVALRNQPRGSAAGTRIAGVQVRDVMSRDLVVLPAWLSVSALLDRTPCARHAVYPVVDLRGALVGLVDVGELGAAALERQGDLELGEICVPVGELTVLSPDDPVGPLFQRRPARNALVLVVENGLLVGVLSPGGLARLARVPFALTA